MDGLNLGAPWHLQGPEEILENYLKIWAKFIQNAAQVMQLHHFINNTNTGILYINYQNKVI